MCRQESPQLIERKTQVDTDAQETSRASKYTFENAFSYHHGIFFALKLFRECSEKIQGL